MSLIYLDNAATTPIDPRVKEAMLLWLGKNYGNPSSVHEAGRKAKVMLEDTRDEFAEFIGARSSEIYFTSGGTEANNFAIKGSAFYNLGKKDHIITTVIEHSAVIDTVEYLKTRFGFNVTYLKTNKHGEIDLNELKESITDSTFLISVMHSNNELGVINNISSIAGLLKDTGIMLHSDMVQSLGKVKFSIAESGVNFASFSGHKIYGPKGLGVLYIKKDSPIDKFMHGGRQERDRRGGTENIPGIAGFKKAIELLKAEMNSDFEKASGLRNKLLAELNSHFSNKIIVNSVKEDGVFLPNIVSISFDPKTRTIDPDTLLIKLDMKGIMVSSGSACTSGSVQPSHVLKAIGYDDSTARSSIRISFGRFNTEADIESLIKGLKEIIV
ncbi:MAG TPA: cysteine desulfurase family protein [Ignavibacteria bacterium]|nr:cysteine desulfurase family protein [Ignavibacteria bacterium]HMQ98644.1 cysteine desulfurase family protein [Ignavibacteria bacterium]